jgi:hypothetical protein
MMGYLMIAMFTTFFVIIVVGITLKYFNDRKEKRECNERLHAAEKRCFGSN